MIQPTTVASLQQMKRDGRKIVGVVAWDFQVAQIADRAGVDLVSVGDSVGINLWGHPTPLEVTMDEMLIVLRAVRRGTKRALVSCDFPYGPLQAGTATALEAARRFRDAGADMVKVDDAASNPQALTAIVEAGIPVFAQIGITPQTADKHGVDYARMLKGDVQVPAGMTAALVDEARRCEAAGAAMIDFTNSGPIAGPAVATAVSIPVIGGLGGGPWLDGRVRMAHAAIGYAATNLEGKTVTYANVAQITLDALGAYADDVRAGRQIKGGIPVKPAA
ncbi:MAG TPA: 3-methyl-2-oxobutanoate hydroxymethyltransferase [Usitatibacter sp.]|nr:3-methyl-2-oxobutanoate hydroxymethyltransferase [Usitatibacter sp.]